MDLLSEPSPPGDNCRSPQSGSQPATPGPPIKPPHRCSSLAFSQLVQAIDPLSSDAEQHLTSQPTASHTPSRSISNIGRKRALVSPLARSGATPGHISQMQRIFQDAKASLQLDAAIASSPAGSMASRLPGIQASQEINHRRNTVGFEATGWRYSTVPQGLAEANLDVREPFPAESPGLPDHEFTKSENTQATAREPMSSGFTSPVAVELVTGSDALWPPLPTSSSSKSEKPTTSPLASSGCGQAPAHIVASTELEQPMTKMHVSHVDAWLNDVLQDSPNAQREQRRRSKSAKARDSIAHHVVDIDMDDKSILQEIMLSTPAKAAADSAKLKRDLLGSGVRASSNKENVRPESRGANNALRCTTPTANLLSVPTVQITPSPDFPHGSPPPSPVQPGQLPPPPPFRRVDSTGSPFPILKGKLPHPVDVIAPHQQWQGYYSPPSRQQFASPPQQPQTSPPYHQQYPIIYPLPQQYHMAAQPPPDHPCLDAPANHNKPPPPPDLPSQQLIYLHGPPLHSAPPDASYSPTAGRPYYSFSTAAAAHSGSSPAPDSRIRDAYRTDTLTPFEVPTTRFRKIGLGATAQTRGVTRLNASDGPTSRMAGPGPTRALTGSGRRPPVANDPRIGLSRANTAGARKYYAHAQWRAAGPRSPEEVTFRSSPPRPAGQFHAAPRRKKMRRSLSGGDGLSPTREEEVDYYGEEGRGVEIAGGMDLELEAEGMMAGRMAAPEKGMAILRAEHHYEGRHADEGTSAVDALSLCAGNERMRSTRKKTAATTTAPKPDMPMSSTPDQRQLADGDEGEGEEVRQLSPYVTPYRKGRGPKLRSEDRRLSYWDADLLAPGKYGGDDKENWARPGQRDVDGDVDGDGDNYDGAMEF